MLAIHAEHEWKIRESENFFHASMIHAEHEWKIRESEKFFHASDPC
jgi:hypothetical protein